VSLRVKTSRGTGFQWSAKPNGDIFLELAKKHDFCILVYLPNEGNPIYYVVPTTVIDRWLKDDFDEWIRTPGAKGQQHEKSNRRRIFCADDATGIGHGYRKRLAPYRDAWNLLS
jgi:hypothetical protein